MMRIPDIGSALVLAATLLVALPTVAADTLPKQACDSAESPCAAPVEVERSRPAPTPNLVVPPVLGMETYKLEYHPTFADDASKVPGPMVLHVPHGYTSAGKLPGMFDGRSLMVLALYPSFASPTSAMDRCGKAWCGDEISAAILLAPDAPRRTHTGSVQSEMEASPRAENSATTFQALPAPSGYEEAFTVSQAATPGQPRLHTEFLVYRDEHGEQQLGQCGLESANPTCLFRSFDPRGRILTLYSFPITMLAERQTIEDGLRILVGDWQTGGR